jgi:two-component system, sensor histidine kinase and response regulator
MCLHCIFQYILMLPPRFGLFIFSLMFWLPSFCGTPSSIDSVNEASFKLKVSNPTKAFLQLLQTEAQSKKIGYIKGEAVSLLYQGGILVQNGFERKALAVFYNALEVSKQKSEPLLTARILRQIGITEFQLKNFILADSVLHSALKLYILVNNQEELVNIYNTLGALYTEEKLFDKAETNLLQALDLANTLGYNYGIKKSLQNLGTYYASKDDFEKAAAALRGALQYNLRQSDFYGTAQTYLSLASVSQKKKEFKLADNALVLGEKYARKVGAQQLLLEIFKKRAMLATEQGERMLASNIKDSVIYYQQAIREQENSYIESFTQIIKSQEEATKLVAQQAEIAKKGDQNKQLWLAIISILFFVTLAFGAVYYKNYQKEFQVNKLQAEMNEKLERSVQQTSNLYAQLQAANQQLTKDNILNKKLLSIISHDLRHPLVNTKSVLDLINLNLVNETEQQELLEQLEGQYVTTLSLIDNLLYWIRNQMAGEEIAKVNFVLNDLVQEVLEAHKVAAAQKTVLLINQVSVQIQVTADYEMMKIVLRNLVSNAIKFTPKHGTVLLSADIEGNQAIIKVIDTGVGMSSTVLAKIEDKQYYSGKGTANEKGSGFGLILVRDLLEKHQGDLRIQSSPGRGSTFIISLPVLE